MKKLSIVVCAFVVLLAGTRVLAQLGPKDGVGLVAAEPDRVKVGQAAPDFSLEDVNGKVITLSDFRDKKSVILIFYRGYW
jgi:cytochrome oxidase Cu insertion factor (SCO1/SenC/PrrC family)